GSLLLALFPSPSAASCVGDSPRFGSGRAKSGTVPAAGAARGQSPLQARLEGNIAVLFRRIAIPLRRQARQRLDQLRPRRARLDHFVDKTAARGDERVGELRAELRGLL